MQSLQADQSSYNRKGVCYIVHVIGRFQDGQEYKIFLSVTAKINKFRHRRRFPPVFFAPYFFVVPLFFP